MMYLRAIRVALDLNPEYATGDDLRCTAQRGGGSGAPASGPYIRALEGLAVTLATSGNFTDAVRTAQDRIARTHRKNVSDRPTSRMKSLVVTWLLCDGQHRRAEQYAVEMCKENTDTAIQFSRLLFSFANTGEGPSSALAEVTRWAEDNKFSFKRVMHLLLNPPGDHQHHSPAISQVERDGTAFLPKDEALAYVTRGRRGWTPSVTPGAIAYLRGFSQDETDADAAAAPATPGADHATDGPVAPPTPAPPPAKTHYWFDPERDDPKFQGYVGSWPNRFIGLSNKATPTAGDSSGAAVLGPVSGFAVTASAAEAKGALSSVVHANPKGALNEFCVREYGQANLPEYRVEELSKQPPSFRCSVWHARDSTINGEGFGPSKKAAESDAARDALQNMPDIVVQGQVDEVPFVDLSVLAKFKMTFRDQLMRLPFPIRFQLERYYQHEIRKRQERAPEKMNKTEKEKEKRQMGARARRKMEHALKDVRRLRFSLHFLVGWEPSSHLDFLIISFWVGLTSYPLGLVADSATARRSGVGYQPLRQCLS